MYRIVIIALTVLAAAVGVDYTRNVLAPLLFGIDLTQEKVQTTIAFAHGTIISVIVVLAAIVLIFGLKTVSVAMIVRYRRRNKIQQGQKVGLAMISMILVMSASANAQVQKCYGPDAMQLANEEWKVKYIRNHFLKMPDDRILKRTDICEQIATRGEVHAEQFRTMAKRQRLPHSVCADAVLRRIPCAQVYVRLRDMADNFKHRRAEGR